MGSIYLIPVHAPNGQTERGMGLSSVMPAESSVTGTLPQAALSPLPGGIFLVRTCDFSRIPQNHSTRLRFDPQFTDR